jgi:hypothetical protein
LGVSEARSKVLKLIDWCDNHNHGKLVARHVDAKCNDVHRHMEMWGILRSIRNVAILDPAKYADGIGLMDQRFSRAWRSDSRGT